MFTVEKFELYEEESKSPIVTLPRDNHCQHFNIFSVFLNAYVCMHLHIFKKHIGIIYTVACCFFSFQYIESISPCSIKNLQEPNLKNFFRYNSHTIQFTVLKYTIQNLCNYHHFLILDHVHHSPKTPTPISIHSPIPPPPSLQQSNLLTVSMDLPILDILCKRDHALCGLLCLASLTQHKVFKVYPCLQHYEYSIPFND